MVNFYYVEPNDKKPIGGVILIHEVWGLNDNIKNIANRLAEEGFAVLAPDLIAHTGILDKISPQIMKEIHDPATRDEAQKKMREAMAPIQSPEFAGGAIQSLQEFVRFLKSEKHVGKVAVMGFCFGGTYSYSLAMKETDLACALPFYGHAPQDEAAYESINCPILAFYGEKDERLVVQIPMIEAAMQKFHKDFTYKIYPNTGHAFMNETNVNMYNPGAAKDAWEKSLEFLKKNLA